MHGITGIDFGDDLFLVAIDDAHLAFITQDDNEEVLPIAVMHGLRGILLGRYFDLPALLHLRQAELRRCGRFHLDIGRQYPDLVLIEDVIEVVHAAFGAQGDDPLELFLTLLARILRLEILAGGALAQHAVTTGATLKIQGLGVLELLLAQSRLSGAGARRHRPEAKPECQNDGGSAVCCCSHGLRSSLA